MLIMYERYVSTVTPEVLLLSYFPLIVQIVDIALVLSGDVIGVWYPLSFFQNVFLVLVNNFFLVL